MALQEIPANNHAPTTTVHKAEPRSPVIPWRLSVLLTPPPPPRDGERSRLTASKSDIADRGAKETRGSSVGSRSTTKGITPAVRGTRVPPRTIKACSLV